jgi:hypothetical protein
MNKIDDVIADIYGGVSGKFIMCRFCNRPLLERLPNGLWRFKFGKPRVTDDTGRPLLEDNKPVFQKVPTPVVMYIHGSLRIKCFRKQCNAWNQFNYFPIDEDFDTLVKQKAHI